MYRLCREAARSAALPLQLALTLSSLSTVYAVSAGAGQDEDADVVTLKSGLKYVELEVGKGPEATKGDKVRVHYTGWLENGNRVGEGRLASSSRRLRK